MTEPRNDRITLKGTLNAFWVLLLRILVWPPYWRTAWQGLKEYNAPIEVERGTDNWHPRVGPALAVLVEMVQNCDEAENFLTFKLDGGPLGDNMWQLTVSRQGYDPYDAAATYKKALKDAGLPVPDVAPVGGLERVRAYYLNRGLDLPEYLQGDDE